MPQLTLMIKPASGMCNMRCTYCFYADVTSRRETSCYGMMTVETLGKLLQRAFTFAEGFLNLAFQGGEPTLAGKTFFRTLLELEKQLNTRKIQVHHSLQTNGYSLDQEWMDIFREGHFLIGVSLDGTKEIHDTYRIDAAYQPTYDHIQKNIKLLQESGIEYNILCVVHQSVAEKPREVFQALQKHRYLQFVPCLNGFDDIEQMWSLDPISYGHFLIETFDLYEECYYKARPVSIRTFDNWISMLLGYPPENCAMSGSCGNYFLIESDGSTYPCDFYVLDEWCLGNIHNTSFFRLMKSPLGNQFIEASRQLPEVCMACPFLFLCRGGCKRDREPIREGYPCVSRLCAGHKMFFQARIGRLRNLARFVAGHNGKQ